MPPSPEGKALLDAEEQVHSRMIEIEKENPEWARVFLDDDAHWQRLITGTLPPMPPEYATLVEIQYELCRQMDALNIREGNGGVDWYGR